MAKKSALFTALKKSIDAKKRLEKHDNALLKHEKFDFKRPFSS